MVAHRLAGAPLDFAALRQELAVPGEFDAEVLAEAQRAAEQVLLPDLDRTDLPLVTVDPAGSRDLDQAVHIARDGPGYLVSYAIADVAAFVRPESVLDEESQRRGETLYFPDLRVPLHPAVLSEGAASLLPDQVRPAVLWQMHVDAAGLPGTVDVVRARVRSRAQLDYVGLQRALDAGQAPDAVALLPEVGALLTAAGRQRHTIDLDLPQQQVEPDGPGGWTLVLREPLPVEQSNAEISLLTGMCAANLMLRAGFGILRTVPPPDPGAIARLRRVAPALNVDWPAGAAPGDVLATLDRADPKHFAFVEHAAALLRGSGYTDFDGTPPAQPLHAGLAAPYAHVTAPLRRLVDRYGSEVCLALAAGGSVPDWVRRRLPELPASMQRSARLAHEVDRAVVDTTEAWLLQDRVGEMFPAVVLDVDEQRPTRATVAIAEPAVRARCDGEGLVIGAQVNLRLVSADVASRTVLFAAT